MATGSRAPGEERVERTFALDDRTAPRQARLAVADLAGIDERVRHDLTIVVSELVANAVRHAPRVTGGQVSVSVVVDREADTIHVEVVDPGSGFERVPPPDGDGGLGLVIVDRVALDWGVASDGATTVWCTIPTTR